jgi:hypothetical protein
MVSAHHSSLILSVSRSALRFSRCYLLIFGNSDFHIFNKISLLIKTGSNLSVFSANTAGTDPLLPGFIRVHPCPSVSTHHSSFITVFKGAMIQRDRPLN